MKLIFEFDGTPSLYGFLTTDDPHYKEIKESQGWNYELFIHDGILKAKIYPFGWTADVLDRRKNAITKAELDIKFSIRQIELARKSLSVSDPIGEFCKGQKECTE